MYNDPAHNKHRDYGFINGEILEQATSEIEASFAYPVNSHYTTIQVIYSFLPDLFHFQDKTKTVPQSKLFIIKGTYSSGKPVW